MNLEELRSVRAEERNSDGIKDLPDSFYRDVRTYIGDLREERARLIEEGQDLYGSEDVRQLTHEIETAQEVAEAIFDRRLAKIVKHASLAAAGMTTEETGLTEEEAALYSDLLTRIEEERESMVEMLAGKAEDPASDRDAPDRIDRPAPDSDRSLEDSNSNSEHDRVDPEPPTEGGGGSDADAETAPDDRIPEERGPNSGNASGEDTDDSSTATSDSAGTTEVADRGPAGQHSSGDAPSKAGMAESETGQPRGGDETASDGDYDGEKTPVRITSDVGEILGVDAQVYHLAAGDVVTLPSENADPLIERDAATRIE